MEVVGFNLIKGNEVSGWIEWPCNIKENSKEIELIIFILYEDWLTLVIFNLFLAFNSSSRSVWLVETLKARVSKNTQN